MKKALIYSFLICSFLTSKGQQKPVELYDLIRSLLPDSTAGLQTANWNGPALGQNNIIWQSSSPVKTESVYSMKGSLLLSMNGKTFSCDVSQIKECPFQLYLEGSENGYSQISLNHLATVKIMPEQQMTYLFAQPVRSKIYKKNQDTGNVILYTYELKFPGRKTCWLKYATMKSETGNGIFLRFYLNESDLKEDGPEKKTAP